MKRRLLLLFLVFPLTFGGIIGCGPKETPEQKLDRLRSRHDIRPISWTTVRPPEGEPVTIVDFDLTNQGVEALPELTVLVKISGADGTLKIARRVTLDLEGVRPGVGVQTAASLPGVDTEEGDQISVVLELGLTPEDLRSLPEFAAVSGG
jgi:hypothetical protein